MRIRSRGRKATLAILLVLGLSACSAGIGGTKTAGGTGPGGGKTLTIGFVSPRTGPLAAYGQADAFVIERMKAYFAGHPITAGTILGVVAVVLVLAAPKGLWGLVSANSRIRLFPVGYTTRSSRP